jgi:hypothetical protein
MEVVSFTQQPPYHKGKIPQNPLDRRLYEHHSWCRCEEAMKKILGIKPHAGLKKILHHFTLNSMILLVS